MRILLVVPSQQDVYGIELPPVYPPLGVLYLASMLEAHGHAVEFVDMDAERLGPDQLLAHIGLTEPDLVGFSCVTPTVQLGFELARRTKESFPHLHTTMGGIHATIDPENTIAHAGIDSIAIGEAEHTICDLADALENRGGDLSSVNGIYYRQNGEVHRNPPRELEGDLDAFPHPAFHLVKDLKRYSPGDARALPVAPIITSRGCPGQCTYCCTKQIFGRRFRGRSTGNILDEIDMLVSRFGVREVHFLDDNLSTNRRRILDLCAALKKRNYPIRYEIANGIRADMVDEEILRAFRDIGMVNIGFGVESGNEGILKGIKKGITKDQVRRSMRLARDLGFETWGFFIIGLYGETPRTVQDTIDFAMELDPDFAKFLILKPYPGSEVYRQLQQDGLIDSHDFSRYGVYTGPVHHLPSLSSREILAWQGRAFRRFYFRPRMILRHLMRLRSREQLVIALRGATLVLSRALRRSSG